MTWYSGMKLDSFQKKEYFKETVNFKGNVYLRTLFSAENPPAVTLRHVVPKVDGSGGFHKYMTCAGPGCPACQEKEIFKSPMEYYIANAWVYGINKVQLIVQGPTFWRHIRELDNQLAGAGMVLSQVDLSVSKPSQNSFMVMPILNPAMSNLVAPDWNQVCQNLYNPATIEDFQPSTIEEWDREIDYYKKHIDGATVSVPTGNNPLASPSGIPTVGAVPPMAAVPPIAAVPTPIPPAPVAVGSIPNVPVMPANMTPPAVGVPVVAPTPPVAPVVPMGTPGLGG